MNEIPDQWPPHEPPHEALVAPLFPLPRVFLYPGTLVPLHVFEPRYRQMVEDLLDRDGRIVIGPIRAGHEPESGGEPPVYPISGLGEIVQHNRLPDGRFLITVAGLARVRIEEVESDRLYRQAKYEPIQEVAADQSGVDDLADRLRRAILTRSESYVDLPSDLPPGPLTDVLLATLELPVSRAQEVYSEPSVERTRADGARRARRAVELTPTRRTRPPPPQRRGARPS